MKYRDSIIAWTPPHYAEDGPQRFKRTAGGVAVCPWPDFGEWSARYAMTAGASFIARRTMPKWQQIALMFADFHQIVVRDGIDAQAAHTAFLAIDEYRHTISRDTPGATDPGEEV